MGITSSEIVGYVRKSREFIAVQCKGFLVSSIFYFVVMADDSNKVPHDESHRMNKTIIVLQQKIP